jgi:DNA-binding MarR family transcriptional regulator
MAKPSPNPDADTMDLDTFVPALLTFVANRLTNSGSATYRKLFGVGMMDFRVLAMLSVEPGVSGARIARVIGLDQAAVSRTLRSLEDRGLVTATPAGGRSRATVMTAKGREVYDAAWEVAKRREALLLEGLSEEEQALLRTLLRRLLLATPRLTDLGEQGSD